MNQRTVYPDLSLLFAIVLLLCIGVIMVYSSSSIYSLEKFHSGTLFLKKHLIHLIVASIAMFAVSFVPYQRWIKFTYPLLGLSFILLILIFIPGIGFKVGGAQRWIHLGPFQGQPAEFAKLSLILYLAYSLSKKEGKIKTFSIGILPHLMVSGAMTLMILMQPDFGTSMMVILLAFTMLFVAGARLTYIISLILLSLPAIGFLVTSSEYRKRRILAFLNPWEDPKNTGFQIIQSFLGFFSGGLLGLGLGDGRQKLLFLPEAHTDFILTVIGEELGLLGVLVVMGLFLFIAYRGFKISLQAPDRFGVLLGFGLTSLIVFQALINMGVVLGILPTKGLPLPFISFGGSALLVNLMAMGILLNISAKERLR